MRARRVALAVGILLGGCGGGPAPRIVVEVFTARAEAEPPREGWRLRAEGGRDFPLAPTGERGIQGALFAAQAPAGSYTVVGTPPWAPMGEPRLAALVPDAVPARVPVGRERTLYLAPPPGRRVERAVLRAPGSAAGAAERRLDVVASAGDDGWLALRFASAEDWSGTVRVAAALDDRTFAEAVRVALPKDGKPWGWALRAGPVVALDVLVLGDAREGALRATALQDGLDVAQVTTVAAGGRVRFERFPLTADGARVGRDAQGDPDSVWSLTAEDLRRGDVRLWAAPAYGVAEPSDVRWTPAPPEDLEANRLQVRREGEASYGLWSDVHTLVAGLLPTGKYRVLWTGPRTASVAEVVVDAERRPASVTIPVGPVCRVQTTLAGALPTGRRYSVLARRIEDGQAVLAHGFVTREIARADHELVLPPGRYRLNAEVLGREGPAVEIALSAPGTRANVRLEPPR